MCRSRLMYINVTPEGLLEHSTSPFLHSSLSHATEEFLYFEHMTDGNWFAGSKLHMRFRLGRTILRQMRVRSRQLCAAIVSLHCGHPMCVHADRFVVGVGVLFACVRVCACVRACVCFVIFSRFGYAGSNCDQCDFGFWASINPSTKKVEKCHVRTVEV